MSYTPQNDRLFNEGDDPEWDTVQIETEQKTPIVVYFHAFFLVIASVLGTGILGLPVKSAESGFTPFLFSYAIGFFMQALIIIYMIELLQRGKVETELQHVQERIDSHTEALKDMDFTDTEDDVVSLADDMRDDTENDTLTLGEHDIMPVVVKEAQKELPHNDADLHFLGKTFLHTSLRVIFDLSVVLHFISILVSYNLAGSQAYAQLMGVNYEYLIIPFGIICTIVIIFAGLIIQPIISIMTFAKGSLLVLMVIVTAVIAANINEPIINNWSHVGRPFLLGTVALGGAANVLPVVFAKAQMKRSDMLKLCIAAVSGLVFVWLLNVLWCYYILKSVPQDAPGDEISLHRAELLGQISTVPLIEIIRGGYPQYTWIAYVVNVFVMVSITVSFITMGTGLKHVLDGFIRSMALNFKQATDQHLNGFDKALFALRNLKTVWKQVLFYCGFFGIVLLIAVTNPRAFLIIMEKVTSMALNLSLGAFIGIMLGTARKQQQFSNIPLPLHKFLFHLRWAVIVYFVFAVVFDIVSIVLLMFDIRL